MGSVRREYRVRVALHGAPEVEGNVAYTLAFDDLQEIPVMPSPRIYPLEGRTQSQPFTVPVLATATFQTFLAEAGRLAALGRLADVQKRDDGGLWSTVTTGRVSDVHFTDPARVDLQVSDEGWAARRATELFPVADTALLWPPTIAAPWRGFRPRTGPLGVGAYVAGAGLEPTDGDYSKVLLVSRIPIPAPVLGWIEEDLALDPKANRASGGNFERLRLRLYQAGGASTLHEIAGFSSRAQGADPLEGLEEAGDTNPGEEVRIPMWVYAPGGLPSSLLRGYFVAVDAPPDEANPLHVGVADPAHPWGSALEEGGLHPADIHRRVWTAQGVRFDEAALTALEADTSYPVLSPRVTDPTDKAAEWLSEHIGGPLLLVPLPTPDGELKLTSLRLPRDVDPNTLPLFDSSNAKLKSASNKGRSTVNSVIYEYLRLEGLPPFQSTGSRRAKRRALYRDSQGDGLVVEEKAADPIDGDTIEEIGPKPKIFSAHAFPDRGELEPYANELLERFQDGPFDGVLEIEETLAETVAEGEWIRIDCASLGLYNPDTGAQTGERVVQVLGRSIHPAHHEMEWLDGGPNIQPLAAPTVDISQDADGDYVTVAIGVIPASSKAVVEIGWSETTDPPSAWAHREVLKADGNITFRLGRSAGYAHARVSSTSPHRIRSAWAYDSVALTLRPIVLSAAVEFDPSGAVPRVIGEVNSSTAGIRVHYTVHEAETEPGALDSFQDFDAADYPDGVALDVEVLPSQEVTADVEPWTGFGTGSISGTAGKRLRVHRPRSAAASAFAEGTAWTEVGDGLLDIYGAVEGLEGLFPVAASFLRDSPHGTVIDLDGAGKLEHSFAASGETVGPVGGTVAGVPVDTEYSGLTDLTTPEQGLVAVWMRYVDANGVVRYASSGGDRDALPGGRATVVDFRPDGRIKIRYDDDVTQVALALPDGRTKTWSGLSGGGTLTYIVGTTTLDDATTENLLDVDETRESYVVTVSGAGVTVEVAALALHGAVDTSMIEGHLRADVQGDGTADLYGRLDGIEGVVAGFPATLKLYQSEVSLATLLATASWSAAQSGEERLLATGVALPDVGRIEFHGQITDAQDKVTWAYAAADKNKRPGGSVQVDDEKANPDIRHKYDDDTEQIVLTVPGGKTKTVNAAAVANPYIYTVGTTTLDDGSVETALADGEERGDYQVEYRGGGTTVDMGSFVLKGAGLASVEKPTADVSRLFEIHYSEKTITVEYSGELGRGGTGPLEFRRLLFVTEPTLGRTAPMLSDSGWVAPDADPFPLETIDLITDSPQEVVFTVRDADGNVSEAARLSVPKREDYHDPGTGRINPEVPFSDGENPESQRGSQERSWRGGGGGFHLGRGMEVRDGMAGLPGHRDAAIPMVDLLGSPVLDPIDLVLYQVQADAGVTESGGKTLNRLLPKPNPSDPNDARSLGYADGVVVENRKPAEAGAQTTVGRSITDLINRIAGNINRSGANATGLDAIVGNLSDLGHAAAALEESGGKRINRVLPKPLASDPNDARSLAFAGGTVAVEDRKPAEVGAQTTVGRPITDLTDRYATNIQRTSLNTTKIDAIVERLSDLGHAAATMQESGGKTLNRLLPKPAASDPNDARSLAYSAGALVEDLKPGEAGAEVTAGKSMTVLSDRFASNVQRSSTNTAAVSSIVGHLTDVGHAAAALEESGGKRINRVLPKPLASDPNDARSLAFAGVGAVAVEDLKPAEASAQTTVGRPLTDLTDRFATNIQRSGTNATLLSALVGFLTDAGYLASGMEESGGKRVNRLLAKPLANDPDDARSLGYADGVLVEDRKPAEASAERNPGQIYDVTLTVLDDGANDTYSLGWSHTARVTTSYTIDVVWYREGSVVGSSTGVSATADGEGFADSTNPDSAKDNHSAAVALKNGAGEVVQSITVSTTSVVGPTPA